MARDHLSLQYPMIRHFHFVPLCSFFFLVGVRPRRGPFLVLYHHSGVHLRALVGSNSHSIFRRWIVIVFELVFVIAFVFVIILVTLARFYSQVHVAVVLYHRVRFRGVVCLLVTPV